MSARTLSAVSADGTRIHTEVYGPEDAPTVVLVHGWTCSTRFWSAQLRDLAAEFRVVVYDQRGHGRTPAAPVGTELLADDLEAVLRATLAPGRKAVLAGHSMGAMALMAASGRPAFTEHAAAVLLCSTGGSHLVEESRVVPLRHGPLRTRLTGSVLGSRAPLGPVTPLSRRILKYATMAPGSTRAQVAECARIVHACPRPVRVAWSRVLAGLDLRSGVRELRVPAIVVTGLADRLTPPVHARRIAATLPDCRALVELPGTGHMTPVEAPGVINAEIRRLVRAHTAERTAPEAAPKAAPTTAREGSAVPGGRGSAG
ncbi:alpha/beta fold hydrolase [Streptomyces sp. NPDC051018]|uniref:alpha/beta fold hydrolase n=1 Tax=Streptomyces sp. NPDC051018 TaxID=3365639 RepID=UPI0037AD1E11